MPIALTSVLAIGGDDLYWQKYFIITVFAGLFVAYRFWQETKTGALLFAYLVLSVSATMFFKIASSQPGFAFAAISSAALLFALRPRGAFLRNLLACMSAFNIVYLVAQFLLSSSKTGLFDGNTSMNACMLGMTFPFLYIKADSTLDRMLLILSALLAVAFAGQTMPIITLVVVLIYMFPKLFFLPLAFVPIAFRLSVDNPLSDNHRFAMWHFFAQNIGITPLGVGTGSFAPIAYQLQDKTGFLLTQVPGGVFGYCGWLHNDYLQIAIEQGVVGLALAIAFGFICFKRADKITRAAILAVATCALANYPLRLAVSQLIIVSIVYLSITNKRERV